MLKFRANSKMAVISPIILLMLTSKPTMSQGGLEELGQLFTNASERKKLDAIRRGTYDEEKEMNSTVSSVTINGVMMRSDGENVIWVNGESTLEGNPSSGVRVYPKAADSASLKIPVMVDEMRIRIKPGQSWTEGSNQVKDDYK